MDENKVTERKKTFMEMDLDEIDRALGINREKLNANTNKKLKKTDFNDKNQFFLNGRPTGQPFITSL